jgi:site-specific recombinase XerD
LPDWVIVLALYLLSLTHKLGNDGPVTNVTKEVVQEILDTDVAKDHSPLSLKHRRNTIRAFSQWCIKEGFRIDEPTADVVIQRPTEDRRKHFAGIPDRDVWTTFIDKAWGSQVYKWRELATIAELQWELALRAGEVYRLRVDDLRPSKSDPAGQLLDVFISSQQKNRKSALIPASPQCVAQWRRWTEWVDVGGSFLGHLRRPRRRSP